MKTKEEILHLIKSRVHSIVPGAKIILFGSRARGDEKLDSDWDLLILLDKHQLEPDDFDKISYPIMELGWNEGQQFSPKLYTLSNWLYRSFTPFYKSIEEDGVIL